MVDKTTKHIVVTDVKSGDGDQNCFLSHAVDMFISSAKWVILTLTSLEIDSLLELVLCWIQPTTYI